MANKRISELPASGALTGAEQVEAVQGGVNVRTTTQEIANLAPATPGAEAFLDLTDVPGSYTGEANKVVSVKGDESGLEFTAQLTSGDGITIGSGTASLGGDVTTGSVTVGGFGEARNLTFGGNDATQRIANFFSHAKYFSFNADGKGEGDGLVEITFWKDFDAEDPTFNSLLMSDDNPREITLISETGSADDDTEGVLALQRSVSGAAGANGIGYKIKFRIRNSGTSTFAPDAGISYVLTDVTNGSEDSKYVLSVLVNGVETTSFEITGDGIVMGGKKITGLGAATANGDAVRYEQLILKSDAFTTVKTKTGSHTLDADDLTDANLGKELVFNMNVGSANDLTIPLNSTRAFTVGTVIGIRQVGAGQVTVVPTGGVTLNAPLNAYKSAAQNSIMFLEKTATDTWYLNGETVI